MAPAANRSILVFGASGATGSFLLPRLAASAEKVVAVSRRPSSAAGPADWIFGDLHGDVAALPVAADTIVSLGPLDAFAGWFARAAPSNVRRVVALSSMSADSKRASPDPGERELAARLLGAERSVADAAAARGAAWTILRPTLIYGGGRDASLAPIARFARRWHWLPIPRGAGGLRQPIHADDIATAVVAVLDRAATFGGTYELGGGERLRFDDLLARIAAAQPGPVLRIAVPRAALRLALRLRRDRAYGAAALHRLDAPLIADNTPASRDFGHAPRAFDAHTVLPASDAARPR